MAELALPRRPALDDPADGMPAVLRFVGICGLPLLALGQVGASLGVDPRTLLLTSSVPLMLGVCVAPLVYGARRPRRLGSLFILVLVAHAFEFGVRAIYLLVRPALTTFPNFNPNQDLLYVHRGLLWASVAVYAMTVGYFARPVTGEFRPFRATQGLARFAERYGPLFSANRTALLAFGLYGLGLIGRLFTIKTGGALYFFNSPSFDLSATRSTSATIGPFALMSEFCPLAAGILLAAAIMKRLPRWAFPALPVVFIIELVYYSFGLYKFGLIGIGIIVWVCLRLRSRKMASRIAVPAGAIFVLLLFPIVNVARGDLLSYNKQGGGISKSWFSLFSTSSSSTARHLSLTNDQAVLDPVFERLNGVEALAVAAKVQPSGGHEGVGTYANLVAFTLPAALRPASLHPRYIPWETKYVGQSSSDLTVIPMPTVVEAYLNLGWLGVVLVPFLLGRLYKTVDGLEKAARIYPIAAGLLGYLVWRLSNIEQNVFIYLLPAVKVTATVMVIIWVYSRAQGTIVKKQALQIGPSAAP